MTGAERSGRPAGAGEPAGFPLYPLLIAAYFPLYLMSADLGMTNLSDVVRPLAVCVLAALAATAGLGLLLGDRHRAALWVALGLVITFDFRLLQRMIDGVFSFWIEELPGIYALAGMVAAAVLIGWRARPGANFSRVATVAAAVMVAFPAATLVHRGLMVNTASADGGGERGPGDAAFEAVRPGGDLPDIVHIVLDGYSRADMLERYYGFDNSEFLDGLRSMGFAVADGATSPYSQTLQTMTSVFTASDLDGVGGERTGADLRDALRARLRHNPVMATLERLGYETAALDIRYDPVRMDQLDRLLDRHVLSNFEITGLRQTVFYPIALKAGLREASVPPETFAKAYERELTGPYFLYLHLLAPHPPFDVTRTGEALPPEGGFWSMNDGAHYTEHRPEKREAYRRGYVEKLLYTNDGILGLVGRIIGEAKRPTVVIIHGDHGGGLWFDHDSAERSCMQERFSPLLAVHASDGRLQRDLPRDIGLANLYRVVFNTYFGTAMPLLPARSVFVGWKQPEFRRVVAPAELARTCGPE
ncbi:sulfatase-like hydrolase/transferase [Skermanella sp. TT6]|uniref:Sulfatase-like hydrolase/transferase n=1 Tax=Skermanella cutis TaxID=2775420 RepID=A0ABX7BAJ0_9PROT|nr:sulfatase-like hydrolase/transferase [Skermanella sp. TT6]QQP90770.1 sulfatase-like hydrolase/transferase [Skermanella sp. TT6]